MNRTITCQNNIGMSVTFGSKFSPFLLSNVDGVYSVKHDISTSTSQLTDGVVYMGMVTPQKNIVLTLNVKEGHPDRRSELYQLFPPRTKGTLIYNEDSIERSIDYYVESIDIASEGFTRSAQISLMCPDPFFEAMTDTIVQMSGYTSNFEFIHEFTAQGEELGTRFSERIKEIYNDSGADMLGLTIEFRAQGVVRNPYIAKVETGEILRIGSDYIPYTMETDDVVVVTTSNGNKTVKDRTGANIIEHMTDASSFIQLNVGANTFSYGADLGEENLELTLKYRLKFLGV